jgi:hypothetical protein
MASETENDTVTAGDKPACGTCGDTGKVLLALTGVSGGFTRDVPCTECQAGVSLVSGGPDVAALRRTIKQVCLIALGAFVLGLLAYLSNAGNPGAPTFLRMNLKDVTPE